MNQDNVQVFDRGHRNRCSFCGEPTVIYVGRPVRKSNAVALCAGCEASLVESVKEKYGLVSLDAPEVESQTLKEPESTEKDQEALNDLEAGLLSLVEDPQPPAETEGPAEPPAPEEAAPTKKKAAGKTAKDIPAPESF